MNRKERLATPLTVKQIIQETPDTKSLILDIPEELKEKFTYEAGQFTSLFLTINGEELVRSYSLCTAPEVDDDFKITIKKVFKGKGSTFLVDQVKAGDQLWCSPPKGHFFRPPQQDCHFILIGAGSGITPLMSILKHTLAFSSGTKSTLIYSCRNQDQIIFEQELHKIEAKYPDRFQLIQILTRPKSGWEGLSGRLTPEVLDRLLSPLQNSDPLPKQAYICGPREFMTMSKDALIGQGMDKKDVHAEAFGSSNSKKQAMSQPTEGKQADGSVIVGGPLTDPNETPEVIRATFSGETVEVKAVAGQSILDSILGAGHNPPYSCMSGACTACMAKLEEGRVKQDDPGSLSDENFSDREILTCQAVPLSKTVKVSFSSDD